MKIRKRAVLGGLLVLAVGVGAFSVARYGISDDAPVEAQIGPDPSGTPVILDPKGTPFPPGTPVLVVGPDGTPVIHIPSEPHPDIAAAMTAVAEDNEKPRFIGELNGFQFIGGDTPFPDDARHSCTSDELRPLSSNEAREEIRDSDIDFEAGQLPSGLDLVRERAVLCEDEVLTAERAYESDDGRILEISRANKEPVVRTFFPEDRAKAMTINGRPSVLVEPVGFGPTVIYMRDEEGTMWLVYAEDLDIDEVIEIAEGLK